MVEGIDLRKPLSHKLLSDPKHHFVKTLLYIYTMQSFIFTEMNKASREKDFSKIRLYGPLASALCFIIHCGNKRDSGLREEVFSVYRGLRIKRRELREKYAN